MKIDGDYAGLKHVAVRLAVLVACSFLLAACSSSKSNKTCNKPREFQGAESIPEIKVPEGQDGPDPSLRLVIPAMTVEPKPRAPDAPCLESPPDYFDRSVN